MSATTSPQSRANHGQFADGNPGDPGNPFARQTAALRAALVNGVSEQDIQDILDILLLNAKGGHLPTIKFLFSYVIGKPPAPANPDTLDLQELQLQEQGLISPDLLGALGQQVPLPLTLELLSELQAGNGDKAVQAAAAVVEAAPSPAPASSVTPSPSSNGKKRAKPVTAAQLTPSPNGIFEETKAASTLPGPPPNGKNGLHTESQRFDWLRNLRNQLW